MFSFSKTHCSIVEMQHEILPPSIGTLNSVLLIIVNPFMIQTHSISLKAIIFQDNLQLYLIYYVLHENERNCSTNWAFEVKLLHVDVPSRLKRRWSTQMACREEHQKRRFRNRSCTPTISKAQHLVPPWLQWKRKERWFLLAEIPAPT